MLRDLPACYMRVCTRPHMDMDIYMHALTLRSRREDALKAKLTRAEVAAIRLYTGPPFEAINGALRSRDTRPWATTIACCYSGVLKLSMLSKPSRVYRGVKEVERRLPDAFLDVKAGFAGGVECVVGPRSPDLSGSSRESPACPAAADPEVVPGSMHVPTGSPSPQPRHRPRWRCSTRVRATARYWCSTSR